jgi:ubiquinone/menaquinone biosynthesis C-methylase UbiE
MFRLEDTYWWYVAMRRIAADLIRREIFRGLEPDPRAEPKLEILDAGAGTGGSLALLQKYGRVTAFDFAPQAAAMYQTRESGRVAVASVDSIPFQDNSFDLVTSFDVVCQLPAPGDDAAVREMARVLKPGGGLFVRVPALQFLHGPHDVVLHTQHRYSAKEMAAMLRRAGLVPLRTTYANTLLFPVALARRMLAKMRSDSVPTSSDVRPVPFPLNPLLTAVLSAESPVISRFGMPLGLSVIALARKP